MDLKCINYIIQNGNVIGLANTDYGACHAINLKVYVSYFTLEFIKTGEIICKCMKEWKISKASFLQHWFEYEYGLISIYIFVEQSRFLRFFSEIINISKCKQNEAQI